MKLSGRVSRITGDGGDGWGLFYKARALKLAGEDIIELTIGEHDIKTDPSILAEMDRSARAGHTGYAAVPGIPELRDEVARRVEARSGVRTTRDNVLITPGGQAGLFATHMAVLEPGDRALFLDPYYATYPGTIRGAGARPVPFETSADNNFLPTYKDIGKHAPGATSLLVNSPNNPTGAIYDETTWAGITKAVQDHDLWLISDEVYDTQVWDGTHISPRSLPDMVYRTMVIGSMSKSHAMTGSRVGWVVGPCEVIYHMINLATHTTYGVAGFVQDAAVFALQKGSVLEDQISAPFRRRREIAKRLIDSQNVVRMISSGGAMYVMLDIRATGLTGEAFGRKLLDEHKIAVMPGESFGQSAAGHIRVALTVEDHAFEAAFACLLEFAGQLGTGE